MIERGRYTSGAIALANLSASIEGLESLRRRAPTFDGSRNLSALLFVRGDLLGRIADHDRAEAVAQGAIAMDPQSGGALYLSARLAARFHRFGQARELLDEALSRGHPQDEVEAEQAALLQATGHYPEALRLRKRLAEERPTIRTLGALASLLAEMGEWARAEDRYVAALDADDGVSPLPAAQLLFEWGVWAMRRGELDRAEDILADLDALLPAHVPGRGHRAEVAMARGQLDLAMALIAPLVEASDDPEYRAIHAELLLRRGDPRARAELERAFQSYEALLARRPEAYADHAAAFMISANMHPQRAVELATLNHSLRDTPRSRRLLENAQKAVAFHETERQAC